MTARRWENVAVTIAIVTALLADGLPLAAVWAGVIAAVVCVYIAFKSPSGWRFGYK